MLEMMCMRQEMIITWVVIHVREMRVFDAASYS